MGGVTKAIGSLFGGGVSSPGVPEYEPAPVREAEIEAESKSVRDDEKRKLKQRRAMSGTVLTSPLGLGGSEAGKAGNGGVLGASFSNNGEG